MSQSKVWIWKYRKTYGADTSTASVLWLTEIYKKYFIVWRWSKLKKGRQRLLLPGILPRKHVKP